MTTTSLLRRLHLRRDESRRSRESYWNPPYLTADDRDAARSRMDLWAARDRSSWD